MILRASFSSINYPTDDLHLVIDKPSTEVVKELSKEMKDGVIFLKVMADGTAKFGYTMYKDPQHGNQPYTWSSNAHTVNTELGLWGTEYEVIECALKAVSDSCDCWWSGAVLTSIAENCAQACAEELQYGVLHYLSQIHNVPYKELTKLEEGDVILRESVITGRTKWHRITHCKVLRGEELFWMDSYEASEQYYHKYGYTPWWKEDRVIF